MPQTQSRILAFDHVLTGSLSYPLVDERQVSEITHLKSLPNQLDHSAMIDLDRCQHFRDYGVASLRSPTLSLGLTSGAGDGGRTHG